MHIETYSYNNRKEIDNIYIHDSHFDNINIDLNSKKIRITLSGEYLESKSCVIEFENMIHFECDRLDLWGGEENRILGIYLENDEEIDTYINNKVDKEQSKVSHKIQFDKNGCEFIKICIQTNTGDVTSIICEKMIFIYD